MKNLIKNWLFKEEVSVLEQREEVIKGAEKYVDGAYKKLIKDKDNLLNQLAVFYKEKKDFKLKLEEQNKKDFKEFLEQEKKTLKNIKDFSLVPGNKVWSIGTLDNKVKQVKVKALYIDEKGINYTLDGEVCHDRFFKTKEEAEKDYNKHLETLKIK